MDRNDIRDPTTPRPSVALRKESVDRNTLWEVLDLDRWVALRKESVDRNPENPMISVNKIPSLSARRAWIEIIKKGRARRPGQVALRKESVDRNFQVCTVTRGLLVSLSARRAWIEISNTVDRIYLHSRRSPQGERG